MFSSSTFDDAAVVAARDAVLMARAGPGRLNAAVVFWVDILLICLVGVLFLLTLSRAIARFTHGTGWRQGLVLRTSDILPPLFDQD